MKSLLGKIALRKYVGLYLGEREVTAVEAAVTPLGPVQLAARAEACPPSELLNVVERVLKPFQGDKRRRVQIAIGLPASRVFFGTRPLRKDVDASPEVVLQKSLNSQDISIDDLTIDMMTGSADKLPVASVAACRKKYMAAVLSAVERCNGKTIRTEPAACALVRLAAQRHRSPRRSKSLLRIFLGKEEGLAVLTLSGQPIAWRPFAMPSFSEGMSILSAARTLTSQSRHYGLESPLDYAMVHGRPDLHEGLQKEGLPSEMGARMIWHEGPELNGESAAYGLALGCMNQNIAAFDLSKTMKPRSTLREIFPWGELACECSAVVLMALALAYYNDQVHSECQAAQIQCDSNPILASTKAEKLETEKKVLTQKIKSIQDFFDNRIAWSAMFRDITANLPAGIHLTQASADSPLASGGGKKKGASQKKSLTLNAMTTLTAGGSVPPEVGGFLSSLRKLPSLKNEFPKIELGSIQQSAAKLNAAASATFTIACQPEGKKGKK